MIEDLKHAQEMLAWGYVIGGIALPWTLSNMEARKETAGSRSSVEHALHAEFPSARDMVFAVLLVIIMCGTFIATIGRTFIATHTGFSLHHKQDFHRNIDRIFSAQQKSLSSQYKQDFHRSIDRTFIAVWTGLPLQHVTFIATRGGF